MIETIKVGEKILTSRTFSIINSETSDRLQVPAGTLGTVVDHAHIEDEDGLGYV